MGLNLDVAGKVSEFELFMKKVLPRNIMWKVVFGKGLEFDGYRDFSPSDDAVNIDWKASVRAQKTLVRKYIEERDRKFMFLVDVSDNMVFGSTEKLKCEYSVELCAALSHLILSSGDRVGFALYNDKVKLMKSPELGLTQFDIFIHYLSDPDSYGGISNLNDILKEMIDMLDKGISVIFIVSDFIRVDGSYRKNLEVLSSLFETVALIVRDPLDNELPRLNREVVVEDPESGEKLLFNPKVAGRSYEKYAFEQLNFVKQVFRDYGIDFLELDTRIGFAEELAGFFKERIREGRKTKKENAVY